MEDNSINSMLYAGKYRKILDLTIDSGARNWSSQQIPSIIGALAFQGRLEQAEELFNQESSTLNETEVAKCLFFLGMGLCRQSQYTKAREFFGQNLRSSKSLVSDEALFFVYQGMAFYRFFAGRFDDALRYAQLAHKFSFRGEFLYGRVLSEDLRGHALVQTGEISLGLRVLKSAYNQAKLLGGDGIAWALKVSVATISAKYGALNDKSLKKLNRILNSSLIEDNYSYSSVLLELGNLYLLKGDLTKARVSILSAADFIYKSQNYRHEIELNILLAKIHFYQAEFRQALVLIGNSKRILNSEVDTVLELNLLNLEIELLEELGNQSILPSLREKSLKLTNISGDYANKRSLARREKDYKLLIKRGQDPINDLRDLIISDKEKVKLPILNSGHFGLLRNFFEAKASEVVICFDLAPGSFTLIHLGEVIHIEKGFTQNLKKLFLQLTQGEHSKKDLIENSWGYTYDPVIHDSVVYTHITRLRKVLGPAHELIKLTETGYTISKRVRVWEGSSKQEVSPVKKIKEVKNYSFLNYRQIQILTYLKNHNFIDIQIYKNLFSISNITASRDLSLLFKKGLVQRVGKARATKYAL